MVTDGAQTKTAEAQQEQATATIVAAKAQEVKAETTPAVAEAPPVKTFTEQEVEQRIQSIKGGFEGTIQKMREDVKSAQKALKDIAAQKQEQELTEFVRQAEASGIPKDYAARFADAQRGLAGKVAALEAREAELATVEAQVREGMKILSAQDLARKHGLDDTDRAELLKAEKPEAMREKALELALAKVQAGGKTTVKVEDKADKGASTDLSKMPASQALGLLWEKEIKKK